MEYKDISIMDIEWEKDNSSETIEKIKELQYKELNYIEENKTLSLVIIVISFVLVLIPEFISMFSFVSFLLYTIAVSGFIISIIILLFMRILKDSICELGYKGAKVVQIVRIGDKIWNTITVDLVIDGECILKNVRLRDYSKSGIKVGDTILITSFDDITLYAIE